MSKRLGIFANLQKEQVRTALPAFLELCRSQGLEPLLAQDCGGGWDAPCFDSGRGEDLQSLDYAVSLGGDGTLLRMAKLLAPYAVPLFGINFGQLGFLAEVEGGGMREAVSRLAAGSFSLGRRSMLQATVLEGGKEQLTCHALNDFVLYRGPFSKLARLRFYINGQLSGQLAADGLVVATATGSTAYSLSTGGPLVQPELEVTVLSPICAHSLTARTLVIPNSETVELAVAEGSEGLLLAADGEQVATIGTSRVRLCKSPYSLAFIKLTSRDYYQTWQSKLLRNM